LFSILQDLFFAYKWNNFLHSQVEQCIALLLQSLSTPEATLINQIANRTFTKSPGSSPATPPPEVADPSDSQNKDESSQETVIEEKPDEEKAEQAQTKEPNPLVINVSLFFIF